MHLRGIDSFGGVNAVNGAAVTRADGGFMRIVGLVAAAAFGFSCAASAAPFGMSTGAHDAGAALLLVKDNHPPKGKPGYKEPGHKDQKHRGPDKKDGHKHNAHSKYKPGHKYDKAPKNWKKHGNKRPKDWERRGCVVVGPLWFCP